MKKAIDAELLQEIVDYIVSKPYREVAMIIEKLKTQPFEEVELPSQETPTSQDTSNQ